MGGSQGVEGGWGVFSFHKLSEGLRGGGGFAFQLKPFFTNLNFLRIYFTNFHEIKVSFDSFLLCSAPVQFFGKGRAKRQSSFAGLIIGEGDCTVQYKIVYFFISIPILKWFISKNFFISYLGGMASTK